MQTKISLVLSSSLQLKTCSKTRKRSCQIFQTNINRVNTLIKAFILLTVTKPPAREKYNHADGDHSTAKQPSRLPASREDPGAPSQQWLDPRNLGSAPAGPALGLQNRKPRRRTAQPPRLPQTQSQCHGRRSGDRHVYPSPPPPRPAPSATPPPPKKKQLCSRGISRLTEPRGNGASPAGKLGIHVRGRGATGGRGLRQGAERPDAREGGRAGSGGPVDRRCHWPDRPLARGCARMLCARRAAESGRGWLSLCA